MSVAPADPRALARRVAAAAARPGAARTLLLDLDGTLAPLVAAPEQARVFPGALAALGSLDAAGWRVVVISGRPWRDARALVPVAGVTVFGSHGAEDENGTLVVDRAGLDARIDELAGAAGRLAAAFPGVLVERKPAGIALHHRALAPALRGAWLDRRDAWAGGLDLAGLVRTPGDCVLELRAAGPDKGSVARRYLPRPPAGVADESLVALGDDVTDEDMFRAVAGAGLAIRVGPAGRASLARYRLESPHEVRRFLEALEVSSARCASPGHRIAGT
ncbi:MAG: trehalose-phosphatase [Acidobacteria bacterium]|nr:trehalose-phosphatase [Acidobacteriota bacterium]